MKKILLIAGMAMLSSYALAQQANLEITLIDDANQPIPFHSPGGGA